MRFEIRCDGVLEMEKKTKKKFKNSTQKFLFAMLRGIAYSSLWVNNEDLMSKNCEKASVERTNATGRIS